MRWRRVTPWLRHAAAEQHAGSFVLAALAIAAATAIGYVWSNVLGLGNLSLIFIVMVLITGFRWGMWPAIFAALLAFLCDNYFFEEPRFTLSMNPEDVLTFVTFLLGALLVGGLTGRLSDRAREVRSALTSMTSLFEASRDLSIAVDPADAAQRLLRHLEANGCSAAVWLVEGSAMKLTAASSDAPEAQIESLGDGEGTARDESSGRRALLRMATGGRNVGMVALWCRAAALPDKRWTRALLDVAAVAIDRGRFVAEVAETRVIAEKEGLRTALLSSLSHDLRTPIATVLASATSLQEYEEKFDAATRRDLLATIQEESERLNRYVANLLEMTRLESGALKVGRARIDPREAMAAALRHMERRLHAHRVLRQFGADGNHVDVDPVLLEQALVNVIENAVQHAPPDSTIIARVEHGGGRVRLSIEDEGGGIAPGDLEQVFEKFFRGGGDRRRASGVGLGLSVTRGLVESFGGMVRAVSPARDGHGTRIEVELPAQRALETSE